MRKTDKGRYTAAMSFHILDSLSKQKINLAEISIGPIQCNWYLAHHDPRNFHCSTQTIYVYCFIYLIHGSAWIQQHRLNYDISKKVTFVKHKKIFLGVCVSTKNVERISIIVMWEWMLIYFHPYSLSIVFYVKV